jgi:hypothetical protein
MGKKYGDRRAGDKGMKDKKMEETSRRRRKGMTTGQTNKRYEINKGESREEAKDTAGIMGRKKEIIFPTRNLCRPDNHILHKFNSFIPCLFSGFCFVNKS